MEREVFVIAGLGNPGDKYSHTRHNVGFDVIDILSRKLNTPVMKTRYEGLTGECDYKGKRLVLVKPQTYMNESGRCLKPLMNWYKADTAHLIVIYDDIDLPEGQLRVRKSGSAGTHNGMRSVIAQLGQQDFPRVRVGVGAKPFEWELADWVLSRYQTRQAQDMAFKAYEHAADCVLMYVEDGIEQAMQQYNRKEEKKAD